jgi:hypothetical protein
MEGIAVVEPTQKTKAAWIERLEAAWPIVERLGLRREPKEAWHSLVEMARAGHPIATSETELNQAWACSLSSTRRRLASLVAAGLIVMERFAGGQLQIHLADPLSIARPEKVRLKPIGQRDPQKRLLEDEEPAEAGPRIFLPTDAEAEPIPFAQPQSEPVPASEPVVSLEPVPVPAFEPVPVSGSEPVRSPEPVPVPSLEPVLGPEPVCRSCLPIGKGDARGFHGTMESIETIESKDLSKTHNHGKIHGSMEGLSVREVVSLADIEVRRRQCEARQDAALPPMIGQDLAAAILWRTDPARNREAKEDLVGWIVRTIGDPEMDISIAGRAADAVLVHGLEREKLEQLVRRTRTMDEKGELRKPPGAFFLAGIRKLCRTEGKPWPEPTERKPR